MLDFLFSFIFSYCQIWLNHLIDNCHIGYITKFKIQDSGKKNMVQGSPKALGSNMAHHWKMVINMSEIEISGSQWGEATCTQEAQYCFPRGRGGGMGHGIFWNFVFPLCSIWFYQGHKGIHSVLSLFLKFSISFQCVYDSTRLYSISFA
jgi:hypothetical protein